MRLLVLAASLWALASAKPEMYKETEDFQYSRSSTDEGSKSGFYGAQRGNMGGNYEKAHNMDSLAQHHMSTLVRQVDGELGEGANTRTGSVYTAGNSRGIFGSGNYDLSNLKGRNFGESGIYGDSLSQSMYQNGYHGAYGSSNARYGSEQAHSSSSKQSGYTASNVASQYSASDVESASKYHGASSYDYGSRGASDLRYHSLVNSQARNDYDQSNANLYSAYDLNNQNRLIATPVKVYARPGGLVAVPISAQTYALHSASLQDKNVASTSSNSASDVLSNSETDLAYKPSSSAKHYESAYSYHKKWEKHDTQPLAVIPTENPFPANSELYEDRLDQTGQQYQSGLDSSRSHLSNVNSGYSSNKNYETEASSQAQLNKASRAYSSGYSNTKSASAHQARYQTQALNKDASVISNAHSVDGNSLGESTSNLNSLVEDINSKPKSYHSSYSYHKSWERRGDPYVIIPAGEAGSQTSQRLTAASKNLDQYSSHQYGKQYDQKSYSDACDIICHQRRKRSYNMKQFEQDADDSQAYLGQQLENGWDLGQQTENKFEHLEDLGQGQEAQNTWDNLENLGQQEQNKWNDLQPLGQEVQNKWEKLEDLGQQTQQNWDSLTDLGQKTQDDFGQQTEDEKAKLEDFGQTQSEKLEDLGQQTQNQWGKLEELGQQTENQWKDFGQQVHNQYENLGQQTQKQWKDLDQQTQNQWGKLEELGQQTENQWKDFGQQVHNQYENLGQQTQKQWKDFGEQTQKQWKDINQKNKNQWEKLEALGHQTENRGFLVDNLKNETGDNKDSSQHDKKPSIDSKEIEIKPKAKEHKFLWDEISQMFDESSKTETIATDNNVKENEQPSLVKPSDEKQKPLPTDTSLNTFDQDKQETPTHPFGLGYHSTNLDYKQIENINEANQRLLDALKGLSNTQNQGFHVGQESVQPWSDLGQQTQNEWSNLGQQTQNEWSNLGQQTEQKWSDLGQQTQHEFNDLGHQTAQKWSDLSQQTQDEHSYLGQQTQNVWSNLDQLTQNELSDLAHQTAQKWSDLSQQTQDEFGNLGQQTQNEWSNLGQQTQNEFSNLGQQTQNMWSDLGHQTENNFNGIHQQTQYHWNNLGQQTQHELSSFGQENHNKYNYLNHHNFNEWSALNHQFHHQWSGSGQQIHKQWSYLDNIGSQTPFNVDKQQNIGDDKTGTLEESTKATISKKNEQDKQKTEHNVSNKETINIHSMESLPETKSTPKSSPGQDKLTSTTQKPIITTSKKDIGRGDISADDDFSNLETFDMVSLSSTTRKPEKSEDKIIESQKFDRVPFFPVEPETESLHKESQGSLTSKSLEDQFTEQQSAAKSFEDQFTDQQQSQFEQQNVDLQQNLQNWDTGIHETQQIYKADNAPISHSYHHEQLGRHLPNEPQQEVIQQQNLENLDQFVEKENKHDSEIKATTEKTIQVETTMEPTTEKPGFWGSIVNKTKKAKDTCIVTTYISTLFYDKRLTILRQCLANVSFPILIVLAVSGTLTSFLPEDGVAGRGLRSELLLDDGCSLNNSSVDDETVLINQELISNIVIKNTIKYDNLDLSPASTVDNDSGMSSGDNSLKCVYKSDIPINNDNNEIKCLNNVWNEIPSCSYDVKDNRESMLESEYIVINLFESDVCDNKCELVGTNIYDIDDDSSILSVSNQSLVPVANRELVKSESQKLVSLSLSILLAAILQAMRCFAQFLEDIVAPQRL
ncbi:unnamed protein product [Danaus chrysippus]|uniref:(African queen) hypothetical protein n=2 Tax=Danaus chrysippus TaxID=151541 RepID=A0A8J2QKM9_9NEOP|nr:unnamed protein product [Danaus chrysippus]